ncbi:MAG: NAD(P)/FAD-dependent oxidoreductase [Pseudomonadota bacterium]
MSQTEFDAIVIGAGFGGIATTAALKKYGVESTLLLEGGDSYGAFWSANYDRIKLHTPWHQLPDDGGLSDEYPMFKPRDDLLEYFRRYAERHELPAVTRFNEYVTEVSRDTHNPDHPWQIKTANTEFRAATAVIATSYCRKPKEPKIEGKENFEGQMLHSKAYRNADPFKGERVLIVGSGNSAAEIAIDLVEGGAAEVVMLVYGPRNFLPLDDFAEFMVQAREMGMAGPAGVTAVHPLTPGSPEFLEQLAQTDQMIEPMLDDLSEFGIERTAGGTFNEICCKHRVPVFDQGTAAMIRSGDIQVIKDRINRFTAKGVELRKNGNRAFDAVILATGFDPGLGEFLPHDLMEIVKSHGSLYPKTNRRCTSSVHGDIHFVGFDHALLGGLGLGHWGFEIAEKIAQRLGSFHHSMRPSEFLSSPWLPQN